MSTQLQRRRGTTAQHSTFTGAIGELTVDTSKNTVVVHDGSTAGGFPLLKESAIGSTVQAYDADLTTWAGVTPGTGVATALAVNVGSSGAFVTNGGALGTPSSGTLTNATGLPVSGITASTSTALGVGSIELGHATDTTISRVSAGVIAVEGVNVALNSTSSAHTASTIELGHATDTTLSRASAGVLAVEGSNVMTVASTDTVTGVKSFGDGKLALNGSTSGSMTVKAPAVASTYVATFPAATHTVGGLEVAQTWTKPKRGTVTTSNTITAIDLSTTNNHKSTPAAGAALTFTNLTAGQTGTIEFINGSNYAITAGSGTKVTSTFLATISVTGTYIISYYVDAAGTSVHCSTAGASA